MLKPPKTFGEVEALMRHPLLPMESRTRLASGIQALCPCASAASFYQCPATAPCGCRGRAVESPAGRADCEWPGHQVVLDAITASFNLSYLSGLLDAVTTIQTIKGLRNQTGVKAAMTAVWDVIDRFVSTEKLDPALLD